MPSKFGISTEAKNRKRFRRFRRKPNLYNLSKRIAGLSKKVAKMPEIKHVDTPTFTTIGTGGQMIHLSAVPEGDNEVSRTGLVITPKSLNISWRLTAEGDQPSNEYRVIIFRWFDDSIPTATDILVPITSGIFNGYQFIDVPKSFPKSDKVQILSDKKMALDPNSNDTMYYKFYQKFKSSNRIRYNGSSPTAVEKGHLYAFVATDSQIVPHPGLVGYSRLAFTDV